MIPEYGNLRSRKKGVEVKGTMNGYESVLSGCARKISETNLKG